MAETKFCILDPKKDVVAVTLKGEGHIRAGADFKIYGENKEVLEHFKLSIDSGMSAVHKFELKISELNKCRLVWQIACCSTNENIFLGKLEVKLTQNGLPANVTGSTAYLLNNIPPCKAHNAEKISNQLFFVIKD